MGQRKERSSRRPSSKQKHKNAAASRSRIRNTTGGASTSRITTEDLTETDGSDTDLAPIPTPTTTPLRIWAADTVEKPTSTDLDRILDLDDLHITPYVRGLVQYASVIGVAQISDMVVILQERIVELTLIRILHRINSTFEPKPMQVTLVTRLIFLRLPTILVAATGFGKSLIFQAYSLLTGLITIQLVPLDAIGLQQFVDIKAIPGLTPVFVNSNSKLSNPNLMTEINEGLYSNLLMGPEQLMGKDFMTLAKDAAFRERVGLLAIDEAHCILTWSTFRAQYTQLFRFRAMFRDKLVLYACSATVDNQILAAIIRDAGFAEHSEWDPVTCVIRTPSDRPNCKLVLLRLPPKPRPIVAKLALDTILDTTVHTSDVLLEIPKTIIFVSTKPKAVLIQQSIELLLVTLGFSWTQAKATVSRFTGLTIDVDRKAILKRFKPTDTDLRFVVATPALNMGVDVSDIDRVIQFGIIEMHRGLKEQLEKTTSKPDQQKIHTLFSTLVACELVQKAGRACRSSARTGTFYLLLEASCWSPDIEVVPRGRPTTPTSQSEPGRSSTGTHTTTAHRRSGMSRDLRNLPSSDPHGRYDPTSPTVVASQTSSSAVPFQPPVPLMDVRLQYMERASRASFQWYDLVTAPCLRAYLLGLFREQDVPADLAQLLPPCHICCNSRCNIGMIDGDYLTTLPVIELGSGTIAPSNNTPAGDMLVVIREWAVRIAATQFPQEMLYLPLMPELIIPRSVQYQLAHVHKYLDDQVTVQVFHGDGDNPKYQCPDGALNQIYDQSIDYWEDCDQYWTDLCLFLRGLEAISRLEELKALRPKRKKPTKKVTAGSSQSQLSSQVTEGVDDQTLLSQASTLAAQSFSSQTSSQGQQPPSRRVQERMFREVQLRRSAAEKVEQQTRTQVPHVLSLYAGTATPVSTARPSAPAVPATLVIQATLETPAAPAAVSTSLFQTIPHGLIQAPVPLPLHIRTSTRGQKRLRSQSTLE